MDVDAEFQSRSSSCAPKPHDHLWYPDGNVVLATDTYLFKVYKGILSRQSTVFRDMFEFPTGDGTEGSTSGTGQTQEMFEGLPMVKLVDDKAEDVVQLLRAVNERSYYRRDDKNTPLKTVIALLLLSTKYDFEDLRKDVITQISYHYPMTLQEYDEADDELESIFQEKRPKCHIPLLVATFTADVDILLPVLYFSGTTIPMEEVFAGAQSMNLDCLRTLILGREALDTKISQLIAGLPEALRGFKGIKVDGCSKNEPCLASAALIKLPDKIGVEFSFTEGGILAKHHLSTVCAECRSFFVDFVEDKRREIWAEIPSLFNCMGWDVAQEKISEL